MTDLPVLILQNVLSYLQTGSDITQCQLTCRKWYSIAQERLYSSVNISLEYKAVLFNRTLSTSNNNNIGKLVKTINVGKLFFMEQQRRYFDENLVWDPQDIFTHIVEYCPNVVKIKAFHPDGTIYSRITYAAYNGQLQFLESVPSVYEYPDIESYMYTVLAFKHSLKKLELCDQKFTETTPVECINFRAYNTLAEKLIKFQKLDNLKIVRHTNHCIINFDSTIQDCSKLKSLKVHTHPLSESALLNSSNSRNNSPATSATTSTVLGLSIVQPRPDIKSFKGFWEIIQTDNSINYFIHKFPKLDKLHLYWHGDGRHENIEHTIPLIEETSTQNKIQLYDFCTKVISTFFKYLFSIPNLRVDCILKKNDIVSFWIKFMKITKYHGAIGINYSQDGLCSDHQKINFSQSTTADSASVNNLTATLYYRTETEMEALELPHIELIEKADNIITKLEVSNMKDLQKLVSKGIDRRNYNMVNREWLDHILQSCPWLKELTIYDPGYIRLNPVSNKKRWRNVSVKKLKLERFDRGKTGITLLTDLSLRLPSLSYLHLKSFQSKRRKEITSINMPFTSFETLVWDKQQDALTGAEWKFYLKVAIVPLKREYYFVGDKVRLTATTEEFYKRYIKNTDESTFDIRCENLNVFWIKHNRDVNRKFILDI